MEEAPYFSLSNLNDFEANTEIQTWYHTAAAKPENHFAASIQILTVKYDFLFSEFSGPAPWSQHCEQYL